MQIQRCTALKVEGLVGGERVRKEVLREDVIRKRLLRERRLLFKHTDTTTLTLPLPVQMHS